MYTRKQPKRTNEQPRLPFGPKETPEWRVDDTGQDHPVNLEWGRNDPRTRSVSPIHFNL